MLGITDDAENDANCHPDAFLFSLDKQTVLADGAETNHTSTNFSHNMSASYRHTSAGDLSISDREVNSGSSVPSLTERLDFSSLKVHCREPELQRLLAIYKFVHKRGLGRKANRSRGEASVVIVEGLSGTGKSTLVKHFLTELEERTDESSDNTRLPLPLILQGKFDELSATDPFSAIVAAFDDFTVSLLSGDPEELERVRRSVRGSLGAEAKTLCNVIPSLKPILIDDDDTTPPANGSYENAMNKLRYGFQCFFNAISTKQRPVVMFLDDLQWCDSASLGLIHGVLTDLDLRYFMFIGSYRSDEVMANRDIVDCFDIIEKYQPVEKISLSNLSSAALNQMIQGVLGRDEKQTMELTELIIDKTDGNIFGSIQVLKELQRKKVLTFSTSTSNWEWHLDWLDLENILPKDALGAVIERISELSADMRRILVLAAFTRSAFEANTLELLTDLNGDKLPYARLVKLLDRAVLEGFLSNNVGSTLYKFSHDRIQEAGPGRDELRLQIGMRLYHLVMKHSEGQEWMYFAAADHLNASARLLKTDDPLFLVRYHSMVAERASAVTALATAARYLEMAKQGLINLGDDYWKNYYDATLSVFRKLARIHFRMGRFDIGKCIAQELFDNAQSLEDKLPTQIALCKSLGPLQRYREGYETCVRILRENSAIPRRDIGLKVHFFKDILYIRKYFSRHTDEQILGKPLIDDRRIQGIVELLSVASMAAFACGAMIRSLFATLRIIRISLERGLSAVTATAMMNYALVCNSMNDMDGAFRYSRLANAIIKRSPRREGEAYQLYLHTHFLSSWKDSNETIIQQYLSCNKIGMASGDFEYAFFSLCSVYHQEYFAGCPLSQVEPKILSLLEKGRVYNLEAATGVAEGHTTPIHYLRGTIEPFDVERLKRFGSWSVTNSSDAYPLFFGFLGRLELSVYFNDVGLSATMLHGYKKVKKVDVGSCATSLYFYFSSLASTNIYRKTKKKKWRKRANIFYKTIKRLYTIRGTTSWHRCTIMEAQLRTISGMRDYKAVQLAYDEAINTATRNGYIQDAGLCSQLAAEYFLDMVEEGEVSRGNGGALVNQYLHFAREKYLNWGAIGLVNHLERKYRSILGHNLSKEREPSGLISFDSTMVSTQQSMERVDHKGSIDAASILYQADGRLKSEEVSVITEPTAWRHGPSTDNEEGLEDLSD